MNQYVINGQTIYAETDKLSSNAQDCKTHIDSFINDAKPYQTDRYYLNELAVQSWFIMKGLDLTISDMRILMAEIGTTIKFEKDGEVAMYGLDEDFADLISGQ